MKEKLIDILDELKIKLLKNIITSIKTRGKKATKNYINKSLKIY